VEHTGELTLALRAADGDSRSALELRRRILRCAVAIARKTRWLDALDATELEEDVPNEVFLRLMARIHNGFDGESQQFRSYLYRVVTSVTADAVRRNLDRRSAVSLDTPFESADGAESTLRDFVENSSRIGCMAGYNQGPEESSLGAERSAELASAISRLDPWCRIIIREAVVSERPHADIATEHGVSVQMLDVSLKRCTERLYRSILSAYAFGTDRARRRQIAAAAEGLPENLKTVFVPWWTHNLSVRQIASDTGLSVEDAKRRLARAKATMWTLVGS
jgi:RNA polymerase sigma factor (sigma-70 family)